MQQLAIVFGDIRNGKNVPVRLQLESVADDVFGADSALDRIMARFAKNGSGVIVYLREGSVGVARTAARTRDAAREERHASAAARDAEWREIGLGAQILRDLGVTSIRLLASRERRYVGIDGFGIAIEATEIIEG
jgi:3,4-dihydroxy 2-butanone 4-phosphate synthase/GTP cyclohydrolase II